jgi:hypothetical protein
MSLVPRPPAAHKAAPLASQAPAMTSRRFKQWTQATQTRARPVLLTLALFATAFSAVVVLRLIVALAYLGIHPAP